MGGVGEGSNAHIDVHRIFRKCMAVAVGTVVIASSYPVNATRGAIRFRRLVHPKVFSVPGSGILLGM